MAKLISADLTNNKLCILEYTTTDRQMLSFREDVFDANIVSHTYTDRGKIIYDKPITTIGEKAFCWCTSLASITIPDSVTTIGGWAFSWCTSLTSITIPDSVTTIGRRTFSRCPSLTEFKGKFASDDGRCLIVDGVLNSFACGDELTEYTIPDSVNTIGEEAFDNCPNLTEFKGKFASDDGRCLIVDGVLNSFARGAELTEYTIPDSVTTIGKSAFALCTSLTSITIPDSVTTIGEFAFSNCKSLTSVTIPASVTTIGDGAFYLCRSLTSIIIPDSVTTIGGYAFALCTSLTSITIPDSVTTIGEKAFCCCKSLTSITIPDSVTKIGYRAFCVCKSLTSVTIGNSVSEIGYGAFHRSNIETIVCYPKIPPKLNNSFDNFENLIVPTGCEEAYANSDWGKYLE